MTKPKCRSLVFGPTSRGDQNFLTNLPTYRYLPGTTRRYGTNYSQESWNGMCKPKL